MWRKDCPWWLQSRSIRSRSQCHTALQAGILGELTPLLQPVQLSGNADYKRSIHVVEDRYQTQRGGDWTNAGSVLSTVNPLGSYRINLAGAGERLDVTLITTAGVLLLDGKGSFSLNQGLKFQATARAAAEARAVSMNCSAILGLRALPECTLSI